MNSATWFVEQNGRRWVAKAVAPYDRDAFAGGLAVAAELDRRGIPSGRPEPTKDGALLVNGVALLAFVPGEPLRTTDQQRIGATLGRVHTALDGAEIERADRFHWVDPEAGHLHIRPWLRPAIRSAVEAYENLGHLSWGLLHADPSPDAFRSGRTTGLIDWAAALYGPWLYDLASAAMYLGGVKPATDMIDAYLETGPLDRAEVDHGLDVMLRFRFAVQADYFARRIMRHDLTGLDGPAGNDKGLEDARQGLNA